MALNLENKKQIATILLAVGLGLVAAYLVGMYIQQNVQQQTKLYIDEYQQRSAAMAQEMEAMRQQMQQVIIRSEQIAKQAAQQVQQPAPRPIQEARGSLAIKTPPGKRAYTILIDPLSAVGGLISPGDYVDILAHLTIPDAKNPAAASQNVTTVLFQNMLVLAIGTNISTIPPETFDIQQRSGGLYITFAMDPEEASLLTFAKQHARLELSLRGPNEKQTQTLQVASWEALSDYVLQKQGTELMVPKSKTTIEAVEGGDKRDDSGDEIKPHIQIFKGGQEL